MSTVQSHGELRDAVRALCAQFHDEYHRQVDAQRAYPEAFVDALTKAGWMAALIPHEYGGSGLGLTEASVIMQSASVACKVTERRDQAARGARHARR